MKPFTPLILAILTLSACASTGKTDLSKEDQAKMYLEMAAANLNEGDAKGSLVYLRHAKKLDPKKPEIHYLLSLTYHRMNEKDLAASSAREALRQDPEFTPAKNTLGKILLDQGKLTDAEILLKEASNDLTYRESYLAKTNLGVLYRMKKNDPLAIQWFSKAILDAGDYACMAHYFRGQIHFEHNRIDQAASDFQKATRGSCTQFSEAHLAQGKALLRLKKHDLARAKFLEIQQLFPASDIANQANDYLRDTP